MKPDPRVPVGSLWRVKKRVYGHDRPLSRWRAISQDSPSLDLEPGVLVVAMGVVPPEPGHSASDNDGHQAYVRSATASGEVYVNRIFFNGDSSYLERVA